MIFNEEQERVLLEQFKRRIDEVSERQKDPDKILRDAICLTFVPEHFSTWPTGARILIKDLTIEVQESRSPCYLFDKVKPVNGMVELNGMAQELSQASAMTVWKRSKGEATRIRCNDENKAKTKHVVSEDPFMDFFRVSR
jgi:hypothetical protein